MTFEDDERCSTLSDEEHDKLVNKLNVAILSNTDNSPTQPPDVSFVNGKPSAAQAEKPFLEEGENGDVTPHATADGQLTFTTGMVTFVLVFNNLIVYMDRNCIAGEFIDERVGPTHPRLSLLTPVDGRYVCINIYFVVSVGRKFSVGGARMLTFV